VIDGSYRTVLIGRHVTLIKYNMVTQSQQCGNVIIYILTYLF